MAKWWAAHKGAVVAFAGAAGALVSSFDPSLAEATRGLAQTAFVVVGIAGAVLQAYIGKAAGG